MVVDSQRLAPGPTTDRGTSDSELRGGEMSFLEHLDELRRRLVNSVIFVVIAFALCWFVSDKIYHFLSIPIVRALSEAERREVPVTGLTGTEKILPLTNLSEGDTGRFVFDQSTQFGNTSIAPGTSVQAVVAIDAEGKAGLFTTEPIYTTNAVIPKGVKLPVVLTADAVQAQADEEKLVFTTAVEPFTLYVTVSLYTAIAVSIPFLLWQIWGFISPALYKHERAYITPFISLSSVSFVIGAAFAYYVLFPPAARYLLGLGQELRPFLKANDYFDFITIVMLAMGLIFQMPAITYVLARIGLVTAGFLVRTWKISLIVILIVAAVVSPTGDIPNMLLFASPMMALYVVSIFIAWLFGKKRQTDAEAAKNAT
jgi:sec-independent protein translocase protein TatC